MKPNAVLKLFLSAVFAVALFPSGAGAREYYELMRYQFLSEAKAELFDGAMEESGMAAFKAIGAGPVGVFKPRPVKDGDPEGVPAVRLVVVSYPSLEVFGKRATALAGAVKESDALRAYLGVPKDDPAFSRISSSLFIAFEDFPVLKDPEGDGGGERYFELRIYESYNELKAMLKVEMFNEGGELAIFDDVGLKGVFYGSALVAPDLPQLTYMLVYDSHEDQKKAWDGFRASPAWEKLKGDARYADTVSKIHSEFFVATSYSQVR